MMMEGKTIRVNDEVATALVMTRDELITIKDGVRALAAELERNVETHWDSEAIRETYEQALNEAESILRVLSESHTQMDRALMEDMNEAGKGESAGE